MTTTDRTGADTATFEARMAELDRLEVADEDTVERVARAIWADEWEGEVSGETPDRYRRYARAAIAALKPAPGTDSSGQVVVDVLRGGEHVATLGVVSGSVDSSGQVVQRVLDLADDLEAEGKQAQILRSFEATTAGNERRAAAARLRAAVTGPQRDHDEQGDEPCRADSLGADTPCVLSDGHGGKCLR